MAGEIYGCGGIWLDPGIENAQSLCGDGYQVCIDGVQASYMGLSNDDCLNKPKDNHFYATGAHSFPGSSECQNYNLQNSSAPLGYNDVYGCGNSNEGWITTSFVNCGAFSGKISDNLFDESKYGWEIRDIDGNNELKAIRHLTNKGSNDISGGVMCCKSNTSTEIWEPWHIQENDDHSCKVSTGCTQTNSLVSCDVEFIPNRVYGCGGEFTTPGIEYGDWMCRAGYSVCSNTDVVENYGLTKEMCASYPEANHFYASLSSTFNGIKCQNDTSAKNGVFGCGLDIESNWLYTISEWTVNGVPVSCMCNTLKLQFPSKYHQKHNLTLL